MSLRRDRLRARKDWVAPSVWWAVFRCSPFLSLVGAAAGGVLLIRLLLISTSSEYVFGPDIPVVSVVVVLWGVSVVVLLNPPDSAVTQVVGGVSSTGVVWSMGRRFRVWNVVAAPMAGVLICLLSGPVIVAVASRVALSSEAAPTGTAAICFAAGALLVTLFTARLPLWGAELTSEVLIARGFLMTRRYRRADIQAVRCGRVTGLTDVLLGMLMNSPATIFFALHVQMTGGRTKVLYASHSSEADIKRAARVVTAWLAADARSDIDARAGVE